MHPIQIGTCGWSYKEWTGLLYPASAKPGDYLACYAEHFPVVEVDSTFYRVPSIRMVEGWRERTPESFRFSLKVPQVITHEKVLQDCEGECASFLAAARLLGDRLACCLLQFGYFNRSAFAGLAPFLGRLDAFLENWPRDVPVAVEIRNRTWAGPELAECLRRHQAVWALADQEWMPAPADVASRLDVVTGPFAYVRLLGERAAVERQTKVFNHIVVDRSEQVRLDARVIRELATRVPVLVFVNNHFAGYAPETVEQLREALGET